MDFDDVVKKLGDKLNDVRDVVLDLSGKAQKKAGEVYSDTKLKLKLADIQRDINTLYKEIGSAAYTANRSGEDIAGVIAQKCDEVERLYGEMEELAKKIDEEAPDEDFEAEVVAQEEEVPAEEAPEDTQEAL